MVARKPVSPPSAADLGLLRVERIGADGDGVATLPHGQKIYLANTLPGELVQLGPVSRRGEGFAAEAHIVEPAPDRISPPCPHFGTCGGCTLQHWADRSYATWKLEQVGAAVRAPPVLERTPPGARRRIDLAIQRDRSELRLGLHRRQSADIVDMRACPVLHPTLFALVQELRRVLARLDGLRRRGQVRINLLDSGPDVLLKTDAALSAADRITLAALAQTHRVPRISWDGGAGSEPAAQLRPATTKFAGWETNVPPGAFLQASLQGEAAITAAVLEALPEKLGKGIVELFAGCGTLTHSLAHRGRVTAFEGDVLSVAALRRAGNATVTAVQRDLARQPLSASEVRRASVVVLDPPFAGASAQMSALAEAGVPIVYVSCNPQALARDARWLAASGYKIVTVAAIDQFLWSARVETVVSFRR